MIPIRSANSCGQRHQRHLYRMGGRHSQWHIAIFGWPIDVLSEVAGQVLSRRGGASVKKRAFHLQEATALIVLNPFSGLAVTGRVALNQLQKNAALHSRVMSYF